MFERRTAPVEATLRQRWDLRARSRSPPEERARAVPRPQADREADAVRWQLRMEQNRAEENARREAVRQRAAENVRAEQAAAEVDTWLQKREAAIRQAAEGVPPPAAPAPPTYEETPKWAEPVEPPRSRRAGSVRSAVSHQTGSSSSSQRLALAQ